MPLGLVYSYSWMATRMAANDNQISPQLSRYAEGLEEKAKARYIQKLQLINGVDPFLLASTTKVGRSSSVLPPVEAADLVSYLVLQTSFVTAQQFKAHKSMEAYNQFVSGWVKDVSAWNIKVSCYRKGTLPGNIPKYYIITNCYDLGAAFSTLQ